MELICFADFLVFYSDLTIKSPVSQFSAILAAPALYGALFDPSGLELRADLLSDTIWSFVRGLHY